MSNILNVTRTIKKKRRLRTAFSTEQIRTLERTYSHSKYVNSETRRELAQYLNIKEKCIKIWFQNRRMKQKRESSDTSNDSSSESISSNTVETSSVSTSPPPEVPPKPEESKTEYPPSQYLNYNTEYSCQLPSYYGVPQNYGVPMPNNPAFYNDNNVYPTEYYPIDLPDSNATLESNGFYNNYEDEMNQWYLNNSSHFASF